MAKELPTQGLTFSARLEWPTTPRAPGGNNLYDNSLARMMMLLGETNVTEYQEDSNRKGTELFVPMYNMVHWLAENWWALLHEPRKTDSDADADYRSRHWLGYARNGVALPSVMFAPTGDLVEITARATHLRFAKLSFLNDATAFVPTACVEKELSSIIEQVLGRLNEVGVVNTAAHLAWARVKATSSETELYCKLIGSMGLSPYEEHSEVDAVLDLVSAGLDAQMLTDLCEASSAGTLKKAADVAHALARQLDKSPTLSMDTLGKTRPPQSQIGSAPWEWGKSATRNLRSIFGLGDEDPVGAESVFAHLGIQFGDAAAPAAPSDRMTDVRVAGCMRRSGDQFSLALSHQRPQQRKFGAARGIFLAWAGSEQSQRLVTAARTRDQSASRAFAAELLAPAKFLKKRIGRISDVSSLVIDDIAAELAVPATVVRYQATNSPLYYNVIEGA